MSLQYTLYRHTNYTNDVYMQTELDSCIVWNAHNTVFSSKHSAVCVTV